ncbi:MAG: T9SS type A sorting domain-containing protein [Ignavibacteria bacterium]|nr:T9SS type A sorting domain-containing protein [Ignavibacteria bacterium]
MKSLFRTIFVLIILTSVSFAGIPPEGVKLTKVGNSYVIDFNIPVSKTTSVKVENNIYTKIEIPEYGITSVVGQPMLPQISFFLMIGKNENTPAIKVLSQDKSLTVLKNSIYPVQPPREKVPNKVYPFVIDENYYNTKGSINEPFAVVSEPFILGGAKSVMVTIFPYIYNPSTNELYTTSKGSFKIELSTAPVIGFSPRPAMDEFFSSAFVNYEMQNTKGTNNYLIITTPALESGLTPFVTHKQGLGFNVTVVNTTVTGTTNTAIKTYIQNLYNNINTRPEFILLVGDVPDIPCWTGGGTGSPNTDWNYALLEGNDLWVDAFLGRFPVLNLTQLSNIINKTIYMESSVNSLWKKNVFMASTDNHTITEGTHNFVIDSFFIPNNFTVNTKLYSYYGATTQQVSQSIDSGKIFAVYSGHGSNTSWADGPPFSQANVNALNNTIFPYVYSFACITGTFHLTTECFAETWIRSPKAGVIFWGSSVNSYWDEDDILERRIGRAMFTDNLKRNAESFVKGKIYLVQHFGSMTGMMQRYIEMYNCMGDPSIYQLSYGPAISHTPLPNTENLNGPYTINCVVTPALSPIVTTKLFWTRTTVFDSVAMINSSGNNWTYNIPGNGQPAIYKYYIKTIDTAGLTSILPIGAPVNYFAFTASPDTVMPVITHTALANVPKLQWPATVSATVTDNIGVDSVWVRWYKNTTANGIKHFKLLSQSGNSYSAAFNSVQAEVEAGDSIFYRVFARDNSLAHNTDSTALYNFKIINQATIYIGTGTTAIGWPYYTFYMDSRTDMLYLSSEIGLQEGGYIQKIGFDVVSAASQVMNGFMVKMQNTTVPSISAFTNTGWTTSYNGTYAVPGTGWQYIELQTPFYYEAGKNLLIEICYNNSSYTSNSTVNGTAATNRNKHQHSDLSSGDGCVQLTSPGSTYTTLPNISIVINPGISGISQKGNEFPIKYELAQNYPNPFNPSTKINFAIPKQGLVTLKVYDVLGREVANLVNEVKTAGNYIVDFDASYLASGVYFYKLDVNGFSDVKRLVLIK